MPKGSGKTRNTVQYAGGNGTRSRRGKIVVYGGVDISRGGKMKGGAQDMQKVARSEWIFSHCSWLQNSAFSIGKGDRRRVCFATKLNRYLEWITALFNVILRISSVCVLIRGRGVTIRGGVCVYAV